ncbi:hypothetical protein KRR40_17505 [Niabella defluvii]|nr:hypothetical protein KRR40_17505 [Niabella sp. I65]
MKLCIALLCLTATHVAAKTLHSQETVSLDLNKARLSSVLKTIEKNPISVSHSVTKLLTELPSP